MIIETKYLIFQQVEVPSVIKGTYSEIAAKHENYTIYNKKDEHIGWINFHATWKKYVYTASQKLVILDSICLMEIINILERLQEDIR